MLFIISWYIWDIKNDKNTKTKQLIYETWSTETENGRKGQVGGAKEGKKVEF